MLLSEAGGVCLKVRGTVSQAGRRSGNTCDPKFSRKVYEELLLKIIQARLQQYVNRELPLLKLDLEKADEPEITLPTSSGS